MTPSAPHSQDRVIPRDPIVPPDVDGADDEDPTVVSRRSFLRRAGVGAATAFVMADVAVAYRAYDTGVQAEERGPAFDAWDTWRNDTDSMSMVSAAVLAASANSTQPWRFTVAEDRIDLSPDLTRSTGANDALNRELDVSLGCALENLHRSEPVSSSTLAAIVVVLSLISLAFGIVADDRVGLLGIAGAGLAWAALAFHGRSHVAAAVGLVLAAVPFAVATAWSVVTPLTAVSVLANGLPYVLGHPHITSSTGGTS